MPVVLFYTTLFISDSGDIGFQSFHYQQPEEFSMSTESQSKVEFIPVFQKRFLHPRYWGIWIGVGVLLLLSLIPRKIRDPFLGVTGKLIGRVAKSARRRARINLLYCFPDMQIEQREKVIDDMFATIFQTTVLTIELGYRKPEHILKAVHWHNNALIEQLKAAGERVIFLVPHGWGVDIPAMLMAAGGQKMAAMFHNQRNELVDWLWNASRKRFGGRMHAREDGIKPFISSVRQGYWGYYLPDQDHGEEHSEFVDFFATYKATLPAIGRLMKVCRAKVIPLFPVYRNSRLDVYVRPPMDDIAEADDRQIARRMNEEVELLVGPNPEQYTWILKLLKTRKPGEIEPYRRKDL